MSTPKVQPLELPARETRVQKGEGQSIVADSSTTSRETFSRLDTLSFFTIRFTAGSDLISQKISLRIREFALVETLSRFTGFPRGKLDHSEKILIQEIKVKRKEGCAEERRVDRFDKLYVNKMKR